MARAKIKSSPGVAGMMRSLTDLEDCIRDGVDPRDRFTAKTISFPAPGKHPPASVRKLRISLGMSQAAFAEMIGVSRMLEQGWERGVREPSPLARRLLDTIAIDPAGWVSTLGARGKSRA